MLRAEHHGEQTKRSAGQNRPGDLRVLLPKASAPKFHQRIRQRKSPPAPLRAWRAFRRFSGANSVASALGIRSGATPGGSIHHKPQSQTHPAKPDISTLPAIGHFYFALTGMGNGRVDPERSEGRLPRQERGAGKGTQYLSPLSTERPGALFVRYALLRLRIDSPFISMR